MYIYIYLLSPFALWPFTFTFSPSIMHATSSNPPNPHMHTRFISISTSTSISTQTSNILHILTRHKIHPRQRIIRNIRLHRLPELEHAVLYGLEGSRGGVVVAVEGVGAGFDGEIGEGDFVGVAVYDCSAKSMQRVRNSPAEARRRNEMKVGWGGRKSKELTANQSRRR